MIDLNAIYINGQDTKSKIRKRILLAYIKRQKKKCGCIVIGKKLKENSEFIKKINDIEIPISDGKWLFKFLVIQILDYICNCQNIDMDKQRIALVTDDNNELINYYIKELTKRSNKVKIITSRRERFYNIESKLYYEEGIVISISSNKRKALQDVDIIFNFDFPEDRLNTYRITENAIVINLKGNSNITTKRFTGININSYKIKHRNRTMNMLEWTKDFEQTEIYESYIYRNDRIENIEKDILNDEVVIESLIGNNGEISKKEYKNILDKTRYLA